MNKVSGKNNTDSIPKYVERREIIQDMIRLMPTTKSTMVDEICEMSELGQSEALTHIERLDEYYNVDKNNRITPSKKGRNWSKNLLRLFIFDEVGIDVYSDDLKRQDLDKVVKVLSKYGYKDKNEPLSKSFMNNKPLDGVIRYYDQSNPIKILNENNNTESNVLPSLKSNYADFSLETIDEIKIQYKDRYSDVLFDIKDKKLYHDKLVDSSVNIEDLDSYLEEEGADRRQKKFELGSVGRDYTQKYKLQRKYDAESISLREYVAGWFESSGYIELYSKDRDDKYVLDPSLYISLHEDLFASKIQKSLMNEASENIGFSFIERNNEIKVYGETVATFLDWIKGSLCKLSKPVNILLNMNINDRETYSSRDKLLSDIRRVVNSTPNQPPRNKNIRLDGIEYPDFDFSDEDSNLVNCATEEYLVGAIDNLLSITCSITPHQYGGYVITPIMSLKSGSYDEDELASICKYLNGEGIESDINGKQITIGSEDSIIQMIQLIEENCVANAAKVKKFKIDILPYHDGRKDRYETDKEHLRYLLKYEYMLGRKSGSFKSSELAEDLGIQNIEVELTKIGDESPYGT